MFCDKSEYNKLTGRCGYYSEQTIDKLKTPKLKQFWRNHLLGIKLLELGELDEFYSIHLYPAGNLYQDQAAQLYLKSLVPDKRNTFKPVTFERFIEAAEKHFKDPESKKWLEYLRDRY